MNTSKNNLSALIIYFSSHGTTKKAIDTFAASLEEHGITPTICNLKAFQDKQDFEKMNAMIPEHRLIVFGSPTYMHHAPPMFADFINRIPDATDSQAACLLTTFGGVSSGVIQYDLAKILSKKNYRLIGGMKVLAEHCFTFQDDKPFKAGHPDEKDLESIKAFGKEIAGRLKDENFKQYTAMAFKDKPFIINFIDDHINKLEKMAWALPNVKVNKKTCTGCGVCAQNCPTRNITIDKVAVHGKNCTYCYGCVRICPDNAAKANLKTMPPAIRWLSKTFAKYEQQITQQVV